MPQEILKKLKSQLGEVLENESLAKHTTFQIGGPAKYYFRASNTEELTRAIQLAIKFNLPYFVLGKGSNILVSDKGFKGLVIEAHNQNLEIDTDRELVFVDSGVLLNQLVIEVAQGGLSGLEFGAGIPGTIGGAIRGNAGAFGGEMSQVVKKVKTLDSQGQEKEYSQKDCQFGYRESIFKHNQDIILSAELKLHKGDKETINQTIQKNLEQKKQTQDYQYPSSGCIFKNPSGQSAGTFIDKLNLKGFKVGQAMISKKHANFIVNLGGAKAEDIVMLISIIKQKVRDNLGIQLMEEIQYVGFEE